MGGQEDPGNKSLKPSDNSIVSPLIALVSLLPSHTAASFHPSKYSLCPLLTHIRPIFRDHLSVS